MITLHVGDSTYDHSNVSCDGIADVLRMSFAQTIRALRSVTQVIAGLQDEIRALRTQLRTSQAHSHRPVTTPNKDPAVASTPVRTRVQSPPVSSHPIEIVLRTES